MRTAPATSGCFSSLILTLCWDAVLRLVDTSLYTHTETSEYTLTSSGKVVVVTSIFTAVVTGDAAATGSGVPRLNNADGSGNAFFSNSGAVAGTFVGVGIVAAAIIAFLFFFFVRRKRRRQLDEDIRVATGGAGDGGAGFSRFNDDDDDEESFTGVGGGTRGSVGHLSSTTRMSSYGNVPLTTAAAGFGTRHSSGYDVASSTTTTPGVWEPSATGFEHLPNSSPGQSIASLPQMSQVYSGYGPSFAAFAAGGPRSQEGILHEDWQDYAAGAGAGTGLTVPGSTTAAGTVPGYESTSRAASGEGSPGDSQEGMSECSCANRTHLDGPLMPRYLSQWAPGTPARAAGRQTGATLACPSTQRTRQTPSATQRGGARTGTAAVGTRTADSLRPTE